MVCMLGEPMRLPILLIALLVALSASLTAGDAKPTYEVIDWSKSPAGAPGDSKGELKHPIKNSLVMRYRVFAPTKLPEKKTLGLIVAFHGLNSDENNLTTYAHIATQEDGLDQDYVVAGGKSMGNGWADGDDGALMQFVDWLKTVYPIDQRRVFAWGHSNGGHMTAWFAGSHPDVFAGAAPMSGYGLLIPGGKDPATSMLEYYIIHGDADPTCSVNASREFRRSLMGQGFRCVYREIHDADHGSFFPNVPLRRDVAMWIDALRHKQVALPDQDVKWLKQVIADKTGAAFSKPETWNEIVRIGGAYGWMAASHAVKAKETPARLALAKACSRVFFAGEETVAALAKLADDEDGEVRAAAIAALGMHANWHTQSAQIALAKIALNAKKKSKEDRLAAAGALAAALPLPMLGNYCDDAALFEATIALFDSDIAEIRGLLFAPLKPVVVGGFGYDPAAEAPARKSPIAAWKTWFDERVAVANGKAAKK